MTKRKMTIIKTTLTFDKKMGIIFSLYIVNSYDYWRAMCACTKHERDPVMSRC